MSKNVTTYSVVIFIVLFGASICFAANPTNYATTHDPYYRVSESYSDYGFAVNNETLYGGYQEYLRMFVPPGTINLYFYYKEAGQRPAISHHDTPPVSQFNGSLNGRIEPYTLSELEAGDCLSLANGGNATIVAEDAFQEPLPISRAGWVYVHVGPGGGSTSYYTKCAVVVDTKVYNEWWDKYMANPDGSNNWERDVESVEDYDAPTNLPSKPIATPVSGTEFTTSGTVSISSTNAETIYYEMTATTDNTEPEVPTDPSTSSSQKITVPRIGESTLTLDYLGGEKTTYKLKFIGYNSYGLGEDVSDIYTYYVSVPENPSPGKPTTNIPDKSEFAYSPVTLSVSCPNATQIKYEYKYSTNGNSPDLFPYGYTTGETISGSTGTIELDHQGGEKTIYLIRLTGINSNGQSDPSYFEYTLYPGTALTQESAKTTNGTDYTGLITNDTGLTDPARKFFVPDSGAQLASYSVKDLVQEYLQAYMPTVSVELKTSNTGIAMVIQDSLVLGNAVVPIVVEKISGCEAEDTFNLPTAAGNFEIIYKNLRITMNNAGYEEDQFVQLIHDLGYEISHLSDHVILVSDETYTDVQLSLRYDLVATLSSSPIESEIFITPVKYSYSITYSDGTTQGLMPAVLYAQTFVDLMKSDDYDLRIDYLYQRVRVTFPDGDTTWNGYLPDVLHPDFTDPNRIESYKFSDDKSRLDFTSKAGVQYIYQSSN